MDIRIHSYIVNSKILLFLFGGQLYVIPQRILRSGWWESYGKRVLVGGFSEYFFANIWEESADDDISSGG
jgi:hypothetical protein